MSKSHSSAPSAVSLSYTGSSEHAQVHQTTIDHTGASGHTQVHQTTQGPDTAAE